MTRGRKPTPTKLKLIRGNPGKRALNDAEPMPDVELPDCPVFIEGEAREQWNHVGRMLFEMGVMTRLDSLALAMLANSVARWISAEATVKKTSDVLESGEGGFYQNPYLSVANKAWEQMSKMLIEFGMTPSSRVRLKVEMLSGPDAFESYLEKNKA